MNSLYRISQMSFCLCAVMLCNPNSLSLSLQVIVTIPLSLLKSDRIAFLPPLSEKKKKAIHLLGAGTVEKVGSFFR